MAFIQSNQNEDDEDKVGGQPGQQPGTSQGMLSSTGANTSAPSATSSPNKAQNFATLQSYLKVNKPQGEELASKVADTFGATGTQAKEGLEASATKLDSNVEKQRVAFDPDLAKNAFSNPTAFVKDAGNMEKFNAAKNASYTGPARAEDDADIQTAEAKATSAMEHAKLADTEAGRKQLVSDTQQNKAGGITALNQALISTNPNAAGKIEAAKGNFSGLQGLLGAKKTALNAKIQDVSNTNNQAKTDIATQGTAKFNSVKKALEDRVMSADANVRAQTEAIQRKLITGQALSNEDYEALGSSSEMQQQLDSDIKYLKETFGIDANPAQYFQQKPVGDNVTKETVATKEDYDEEKALQQLMGGDYLPDDASQAGTVDARAGYGYDQQRFGQDLTKTVSAAERNFIEQHPYTIGQYDGKIAETTAKILERNKSSLDPKSLQWLDFYNKAKGITPPTKPTTDPNAPPKDGNNGRITNGQYEWWNGSKWIAMKPTKYENGKFYNWDAKTGQWKESSPIGGSIMPVR